MKDNRINKDKLQLLRLLKKNALKSGKVVLSSGKVSNFYLDGRQVSLCPQGAYLISRIILDFIKGKNITAIGGPTLGADPIVGAVLHQAAIKKKKLNGFIVRKAAKQHGMQRLIEGPILSKKSRVVLVDDVATTGGSLVEAKLALDRLGVGVVCAIVIVDREEGAEQNLARVNCPLIPVFRKRDICG